MRLFEFRSIPSKDRGEPAASARAVTLGFCLSATVAFCLSMFVSATTVRAQKDLTIGALATPNVIARQGVYPDGESALSAGTTACNEGTIDIPFQAPMATEHPGMIFAFYRQVGPRFEQIGVSDVRHFYFALSGSHCSTCSEPTNGTYLAPGCSDAVGAGTNADQFILGPRPEWNPYLGEWDCVGSHFSGGLPDCIRRHDGSSDGPLDHRLRVRDEDLAVPEARLFFETYYLTQGDSNRLNNPAYREVDAVWTGSQWSFAGSAPLEMGSAAKGTLVDSEWFQFPDDGELLVSSSASDNGDGTWHYEYSVYNLAAHLGVRRLAVPVGSDPITNADFHRADSDPLLQWDFTLVDGEIVWEVDPESIDPEAPALLFGELFNFRFDSEAGPASGLLSVEAWRSADELSVTADVPQSNPASVEEIPESQTPGPTLAVAPNPSTSGEFVFRLDLPTREEITIEIFDAAGKLVGSLLHEERPAGTHELRWSPTGEGRGEAAGVFFARMRSATGHRRMLTLTLLGRD